MITFFVIIHLTETHEQQTTAHLVLRQSFSIGFIQYDLHDTEDLLCYRRPSTVFTLLLSYQCLMSTSTSVQSLI